MELGFLVGPARVGYVSICQDSNRSAFSRVSQHSSADQVGQHSISNRSAFSCAGQHSSADRVGQHSISNRSAFVRRSSRSAFDIEQVSILCRVRQHFIVQASIRIPIIPRVHQRYYRRLPSPENIEQVSAFLIEQVSIFHI